MPRGKASKKDEKAEFVVDYETLIATVTEMKRVADITATMPILSCVRIKSRDAVGDGLDLSATDLDAHLTRVLTHQANRVKAGDLDVCVCVKKLAKVLQGVPKKSTVALTAEDAGKLKVTINAIGVAVTLPNHADPQDFPAMPDPDDAWKPILEWDSDPINEEGKGLAFVGDAMSNDNTRYNLCGVYFDGEAKRIVATDGHRLHMEDVPALKGTALLSRTAMEFLLRMTNRKKDVPESFAIYKSGDYVRIVAEGGWRLMSRVIDGQFPDVDQVIWSETKHKPAVELHADADKLIAALKQVAKFAPKDGGATRIYLTDEGIRATTCEGPDEADVEVDLPLKVVRQTGGPIMLGLNIHYLLNTVKYADDTVVIFVKDYAMERKNVGGKAVNVETGKCNLDPYLVLVGGKRRAIVMPMRL